MLTSLLSPRRRWLSSVLLVCLVWTPGCRKDTASPEVPAASNSPQKRYVRTELYFGLSQGDGGVVSQAQWQEFLDKHITPAFPDGLTVIDAYGQYANSTGKVLREGTKLVIILHEPSPAADAKLKQLIAGYRRQFKQESVLRTTAPASVRFE